MRPAWFLVSPLVNAMEAAAGTMVGVWPVYFQGWWWTPSSPGAELGDESGRGTGVVHGGERTSHSSFLAGEDSGAVGSGGDTAGGGGEGVASENDAALGVENRRRGGVDTSGVDAGVVRDEKLGVGGGGGRDGDGSLSSLSEADEAERSTNPSPVETEEGVGGASDEVAREAECKSRDGKGRSHGGGGKRANEQGHGGRGSSEPSNSGNGGGTGAGSERGRRLFLEFYGPIVGFFASMGFSAWVAELLTMVATQICPLLCAAPLLRMSTRRVDSRGNAGNKYTGRLRSAFCVPPLCVVELSGEEEAL